MLLSWDLPNIENNISAIVCLSIFGALLSIVIIIFILMSINKKLRQTIAKCMDLVDDLKKSPLRYKIQRIYSINLENKSFEKELMIWRTKFEILFEIKLFTTMSRLDQLMNDKKNTHPVLKNIHKFDLLYSDLLNINQNAHMIMMEITDAMEMEYIQRDTAIGQKVLFADLEAQARIETFKGIDIDKNKLDNTLEAIQELFGDFYRHVDFGSYRESWNTLLQLNQALTFLIEVLDTIPYVYAQNETVIPEQMTELKNKYVTFGKDGNKLSRNGVKYAELEETVDTLRVRLKNEISRLQYLKARKTLQKIVTNISEYRNFVENEDHLKNFFENNLDTIRTIFDQINSSSRAIERSFNNAVGFNKQVIQERNDFEAVRATFTKTKQKADLIFSQLDINISKDPVSYPELKDKLSVVLQESLSSIDDLEKCATSVEKMGTNVDSLLNTIIMVQSILNQCEVKINQYKSIAELQKFIPAIQDLHNAIGRIAKQDLSRVATVEDKELINKEINNIHNQTIILVRDLNDCIFLDFIAQEIIVYLERFVTDNPAIDQAIEQCEIMFANRQLNQMIGYSLKVLGNYKNSLR